MVITVQVKWHEALLLHPPESITVDMSTWRGHFGTLMPFYAACERSGGFTGRSTTVCGPPQALKGGFRGPEAQILKKCGAVDLEKLGLYKPAVRMDDTECDWGLPIT